MAEDLRPDPDQLLDALNRNRNRENRGRLRVFFGMCPGVGKTYAMLQEAHRRRKAGARVLIGIVETHGRGETAQMMEGLDALPRRKFSMGQTIVEEFDIDAALQQKPHLLLVDELAHSNAHGSRHPKRWQDVKELIDSGIEVWTTLNVQHVESQADVVASITGIVVRESVPDTVLDLADEITLIDLTPEQLRSRLMEGKVYQGERASTAAENFFRIGNLSALREMTLRIMAHRAGRERRHWTQSLRHDQSWRSGERLMVAVGASPFSGYLIRWTRRAAESMGATWLAASVETGRELSEDEKRRLTGNLTLVRELGGEVVEGAGHDVATTLIRLAQQQQVTQIIVGRSPNTGMLQNYLKLSLADRLLKLSRDTDVCVVCADKSGRAPILPPLEPPSDATWKQILHSLALIVCISGIALLLRGWMTDQSMAIFYLMGVVAGALRFRRSVVLLQAVASAMIWNFFFTEPFYTFAISRPDDILMFVIMLGSALVVGDLTHSLRRRERIQRQKEAQATALLGFTKAIAWSITLDQTLANAIDCIQKVLASRTAIWLSGPGGELLPDIHPASTLALDVKERAVAQWSFKQGQVAGRYSTTLPDSRSTHFPLITDRGVAGVLSLELNPGTILEFHHRQLVENFAFQLALAVERSHLEEQTLAVEVAERSEKLQKALFDSLSHEIKTPLSVISSAAESLVQDNQITGPAGDLASEISKASVRLMLLIENLLNMTRLESGALHARPDWCDLGDVIHSVIQRVTPVLENHTLKVDVKPLPIIRVDEGLLQEVLVHLLSNAAHHTPAGTPVSLKAGLEGHQIVVQVSDLGPGINPAELPHIFDKFYRGSSARSGGTGLGLSIVKGLVEVMNGTITSRNLPSCGAEFTFRLPVEVFIEKDSLP
ncbi:MAG: sensor histidine kinase KdpD [Verrucomicrobiae bacterium]|nr:sensor histidine kinase KdpD [Verrucomicrobiae bacterium]